MLLRKAYTIYRKEGLKELLDRTSAYIAYRIESLYFPHIRPRFPVADRTVTYNDVVVQPYRTIDSYVPIELPPNKGGHKAPPQYEYGLGNSLRKNVADGDDVVVIGGGIGATAVIAACAAGSKGSVVVYEGAANMVEHIQNTLRLNDVPCSVDVRHAIVGPDSGLHGQPEGAKHVSIEDIPDCDVLEMDCEGGETELLGAMERCPGCIIVETHRNRDRVETILQDLGYRIESAEIAEVGPYESRCEEHEIFALTAFS